MMGAAKRPEFFVQQAEDARCKAEAMRDLEAKQTMLRVAGMWDAMAAIARKRPSSRPIAQQEPQPAATLGDVLYARSAPRVSEEEWATLVQLVAAGEQVALHALYERANRLVFTLAMRISSSRETAEELTIDVFHDVWRRAASYSPVNGSVLGWIMNMARSRAIDRLRFDSRRKRNASEETPPLAEPAADMLDVLAAHEQSVALRSALAVLTRDERHAIEMTFFGGLTHAEAAAQLDTPLGTVKTRIRSGLHKLRRKMDPETGQP